MVWSFSHSLLFLTFFSWFLIKVRVNSSRQFHVQNSLTHFIVSQRELLLTRFLFKVRLLYQAPNMQYSILIQFKFLFWDYLLKRLKSFFKRLCPHHDSLYFSLLPPFENVFALFSDFHDLSASYIPHLKVLTFYLYSTWFLLLQNYK